jgi:hypothetical protein
MQNSPTKKIVHPAHLGSRLVILSDIIPHIPNSSIRLSVILLMTVVNELDWSMIMRCTDKYDKPTASTIAEYSTSQRCLQLLRRLISRAIYCFIIHSYHFHEVVIVRLN